MTAFRGMGRTALPVLALAALAGCGGRSDIVAVTPDYRAAVFVPSNQGRPPYAAVPDRPRRNTSGLVGGAAVANANRSATVDPTPEEMLGSTWVIRDVQRDKTYNVCTSFGLSTVFLLPDMESYASNFVGDPKRYVISASRMGSRTAFSVAPAEPGVHGDLSVVTTGGIYGFNLLACKPRAAIRMLDINHAEPGQALAAGASAMPQPDGDYTPLVVTPEGDRPAWMPDSAYADSRKMVVHFTGPVQTLPLLMTGANGEQVASYRAVRGQGDEMWVVTDRRVTRARFSLAGEAVTVDVDPRMATPGGAPPGGGPSWTQGQALPQPPSVLVVPSAGAAPISPARALEALVPGSTRL